MIRFVCDVETTGLDPIRNDIIEICLLAINEKYEVLGEFHRHIAPEMINEITWDKEAQGVHGYTPEEAMGFMPRRRFCIELLNFLLPFKNEDNTAREFICHALPDRFFDKKRNTMSWPHIDYHFLEWAFRKEELQWSFWKVFAHEKIVSTIKLAREYSGEHRGHKLDRWASHIGFNLDHHKAQSDTYACLELYKYFMEQGCTILGITNKEESTSSENEFKLASEGLFYGP